MELQEESSGAPKDSRDSDLQPEVIVEPVSSPVSEKARQIFNAIERDEHTIQVIHIHILWEAKQQFKGAFP